MAKLPGVEAQRPVPRPARAIAQISPGAAGAVGAAMQDFGNTANLVGLQIADREATAQAKEADALASDKIRALLYDPETGFANLSGGSAVAARQKVLEQLDGLSASLTEGMSNAARRKFEDSMTRRIDSAKQTVDTHTSGERKTWINGASAARAESAYQDSLVNPGATAESLRIIEGEIRGTGAREGWSAEQTALKVAEARSKVYAGNAERIALVDPQAAAAFLAENKANMMGSDVVALEAKLIPMAKAFQGRNIGAAAASGIPTYTHNTKIEYSMGPARPNKPAAPVISVIGKSVEDILGAGARVVVTSGQENEGQQHGSNRHGTGNAADVAIYRADGSQVMATNPEMAAIAKAAARNGALGIGFGAEYMGGGHIHVDLVPPGQGQANTWASGGAAMRDEIVGLIGDRANAADLGLGGIMEIADPVVRDAALEEYNLRASVADGARKASVAAASNQAFTYLESGGSLSDLTLDEKTAIGQAGMTSLRSYENQLRSGSPVETDLSTYAQLRGMEIKDPESFKAAANSGFVEYADRLSPADRKSLIDKASSPDAKGGALAASALMSVATSHLRGIGIKANDPKEAVVQSQLLMWQDQFKASTGAYPTQLEVDKQVGRMLMEVVIDPPGMMNEFGGMAFEAGEAMTIGTTTIPKEVVNEQIMQMTAEGVDVNYDTLAARLSNLLGEQ